MRSQCSCGPGGLIGAFGGLVPGQGGVSHGLEAGQVPKLSPALPGTVDPFLVFCASHYSRRLDTVPGHPAEHTSTTGEAHQEFVPSHSKRPPSR